MDLKNVMVHLELEKPNDGLLAIAADLGKRFDAGIIGIAGCQPVQLLYDGTYMSSDVVAEDREEIEKEMKKVEARFHETLKGKVGRLEWRSDVTFDPLADYIAQQARAADLVLTGPDIGGSMFDHTRQVRIADLVFRAGRPVLVVPDNCAGLDLGEVVIGWKDARESRRAVADALPLLKLARHVTVVTVAHAQARERARQATSDVVDWLKRHGISAQADIASAAGSDAASLAQLVEEKKAGLVVAGAYGHSRFREWVLGGVTGDYLIDPDRPVLLSH